jgi:hypothetical protein
MIVAPLFSFQVKFVVQIAQNPYYENNAQLFINMVLEVTTTLCALCYLLCAKPPFRTQSFLELKNRHEGGLYCLVFF